VESVNDDDLIPAEEEGPAAWYVSWADMVTILLTFFILIFTFSTISENKFIEATSSIQRAFGMPIQVGVPVRPDLALDRTAEEIHEMIQEEALTGVLVQDFGDRVVVSMDTDVAFTAGSADLTPEGRTALERLRPALESAPGEIRVEGHTCDLPVAPGSPFGDNWGLSTARAVEVLQELVGAGFPAKRIGAMGYADQRPRAPNDGEANRRKNRRVEFVIEKKMVRADD
jgi:chemotaxis protein MotB